MHIELNPGRLIFEQIWISCEVDEPRASYTEWSKAET